MKMYQVGGSVRNEFFNKFHSTTLSMKDIDFAVETESFSSMRKHLLEQGFVIHTETPQYLTIRCRVPEGHHLRQWTKDADFTLCRTESEYSDGRHPDDLEVGTIDSDLCRRDFTMNAIAIESETQQVLDPFGGLADIQKKTLRCVGDPYERIIEEDALRALRGLRFGCTMGLDFDKDFRKVLHHPDLPAKLLELPVERVFQELNKMFKHDTPGSLDKFYETTTSELRQAIFRDGLWLKATTEE